MNQLFKRLGALLLVFALVVGMLPVSVAAEGTEIPLKVRLVKTNLRAKWEATGEGDEPEADYMYTVELMESKLTNEEDIRYYWETDFTTIEEAEKSGGFVGLDEDCKKSVYYTNNGSNGVAVKIHVDGLTLIAAIPVSAGSYNQNYQYLGTPQTWSATTNLKTVYVGVPFVLPVPTFEQYDVSGSVDATIETVDKEAMPSILKKNRRRQVCD